MESNKKRYGIMGGTFDPIHLGHLVLAEEIRDKMNLEKVIFVPTGIPPHKDSINLTETKHRYLMTLLATITNPHFEVSSIEIERKGVSYTIDTINAFKDKFPDVDFYFITGADAILEISTWKDVDELLNACNFVAATRPGFNKSLMEEKIKSLEDKYRKRIYFVSVAALEISSTDIRNRIKERDTVKYLLPDSVKYYIEKNNLYKD
ncbi:nicotinate-nucleotide adenylyltransferase [Clostridiisalibacter paucivorans]|uniref:nicotinate-nucleotide adenylyltransferase n=1 Tax=Clostridiisalibacter paucivorans TaxID=408753 RepID=UPI0004793F4E|nr:nicotinate-nucleotide adenylyltransferase [Clostridiisalibacter paucivorans]